MLVCEQFKSILRQIYGLTHIAPNQVQFAFL